MNSKLVRFGVLTLLTVVTTSQAFADDSFEITQNGRTYLCTLEGDQNSCLFNPGREECDQPIATGEKSCVPGFLNIPYVNEEYAQSCRTFDGCGNLSGTFDKHSIVATGINCECPDPTSNLN